LIEFTLDLFFVISLWSVAGLFIYNRGQPFGDRQAAENDRLLSPLTTTASATNLVNTTKRRANGSLILIGAGF